MMARNCITWRRGSRWWYAGASRCPASRRVIRSTSTRRSSRRTWRSCPSTSTSPRCSSGWYNPDRMLAVVIVSWNVCDLLRNCLTSLLEDLARAGEVGRVIVVDSASQDGTLAMLHSDFPSVELLACDDNIGYVKGNNLALERLEIRDWKLEINPLRASEHPISNLQSLIS